MEQKSSSLGVISFIFSIIGFFLFGIPLGIISIVLGAIEEPKTKLAVAGIVIGIIDIIGALIVLSMY